MSRFYPEPSSFGSRVFSPRLPPDPSILLKIQVTATLPYLYTPSKLIPSLLQVIQPDQQTLSSKVPQQMERTLLVVPASKHHWILQEVLEALQERDFTVLAEEKMMGRKLSEAGLELDSSDGLRDEETHTVLVVERVDAFLGLQELKGKSALSIILPPSPSTAKSIIDSLFPSLGPSNSPSTPSRSHGADEDKTPTKLFPLSNLALQPKANLKETPHRNLSPKIAQALEQLEANDSTGSAVDSTERRVFGVASDKEEEDEAAPAELTQTLSEDDRVSTSSENFHADTAPRPPSSAALSTSATSATSSSSFKARPAPPPPTAQPRTTKSSALRLSGALPPPTPRASVKRQSISTSERAALDRLTRRQSVQLPPIAASPKVEVRMSKAAMLRMGVPLPPPTENTKRTRQSTSTSAGGSDASIRRMSLSSSLKSLREPTIAPRATKSSALRTGSSTVSSTATARHRPLTILNDDDSGNVNPSADSASHKRRHSVQVQSTRPPAIEPRMSRASMLRTGQSAGAAPSSSSSTRIGLSNVNFDGVPGHKRRESIAVPSMHQAPAHAPRPNRASLLRQKGDTGVPVPTRRPASAISSTSTVVASSSNSSTQARTPTATSAAPTPRLNRAAELRQKAMHAAGGKEQVPSASMRREGGGQQRARELSKGSAVGTGQKGNRPLSAMSDLSNCSRA